MENDDFKKGLLIIVTPAVYKSIKVGKQITYEADIQKKTIEIAGKFAKKVLEDKVSEVNTDFAHYALVAKIESNPESINHVNDLLEDSFECAQNLITAVESEEFEKELEKTEKVDPE